MLEELLHWLGFGLCHQLPERSFFGGGVQVPVCARDTGIYLGFAVSLLVIAVVSRGRRPQETPRLWLVLVGLAFLGAMALDGVSSYAGLRETTNDIRLITGILAGYSLTLAFAPILNGQLWRRPGPERVLGRGSEAIVWLVTVPLLFVLVSWVLPVLGVVYPVLVAAGILFTFSAVNLAIVCLLPPFENRYDRLRQAWLPIVLSFCLTAAELWVTGSARAVLERMAGLA
ncbi:MAG: DUF2085 domain-containing protein [Actinomycetota bacterium]|jgi:uncharacterized membrane protein|nr:DUF2085 domain-containing protein [Actinomycetota bacterium]